MDGVPFDTSHLYASGNIAEDMTANVAPGSTGGILATRLYNIPDDPGMKDMLSYLWIAALEELGGATGVFPIPDRFPQKLEKQEFSYAYLGFQQDDSAPAAGRWCMRQSIDGKGRLHHSQWSLSARTRPWIGKALQRGSDGTALTQAAPEDENLFRERNKGLLQRFMTELIPPSTPPPPAAHRAPT